MQIHYSALVCWLGIGRASSFRLCSVYVCFFMQKFATYQNLVNLIARLQAKCTVIQTALVGRNGGEMRLVASISVSLCCTVVTCK